ncbi:hypothetical protein H4582DRAFT_524806 [Lactarius indigo]|nr:hypothetical protein H4582DRAFT_524806 [Lactarius indigo]
MHDSSLWVVQSGTEMSVSTWHTTSRSLPITRLWCDRARDRRIVHLPDLFPSGIYIDAGYVQRGPLLGIELRSMLMNALIWKLPSGLRQDEIRMLSFPEADRLSAYQKCFQPSPAITEAKSRISQAVGTSTNVLNSYPLGYPDYCVTRKCQLAAIMQVLSTHRDLAPDGELSRSFFFSIQTRPNAEMSFLNAIRSLRAFRI